MSLHSSQSYLAFPLHCLGFAGEHNSVNIRSKEKAWRHGARGEQKREKRNELKKKRVDAGHGGGGRGEARIDKKVMSSAFERNSDPGTLTLEVVSGQPIG